VITEQRLRHQHLVGARFTDPVSAVSWFGAVQSQDFAGSVWGVGQRCAGVDSAALRRLFDDGAIVRTHVLRPTWHLVAPPDLRWLLALTASRVQAANAAHYRRSGLDAALLGRSADLITAALQAGRQLTRAELAEALARGGISARGQRLTLIAMWCELEAIICSGAMRGRQHTYALVDVRVPATAPRERDDALGELAQRYFISHGPAQVPDFAWWSGLTLSDARLGLGLARVDLTELVVDGRTHYCGVADPPTGAAGPQAHLLPNFDEYVVAYQDRSALFGSAAAAKEFDGITVLSSPLVVYRGRVAGRWRRTVHGDRVRVTITSPAEIGKTARRALTAAAARYGRFVGLPVELDLPED
jgi:hypothetical protein